MQFPLKKHKSAISHLDEKEDSSLLKENASQLIRRTSRQKDCKLRVQLNDCKFAINRVLKIKREEYQYSIRNSMYKLNTTISWAKESQLHLEDIQKSQIKINSKNNAKLKIVIDKETIKLKNEANCKDLTCPKKPRDEGFLPQNNLFCVKEQSVLCYEDVFPMYRLGNTITSYDKRIYIYGGHSFKGLSGNNMHLHYYDLKAQLWKKIVNSEGQIPYLCTCYHTSEQYRNYLIFIGGISIDYIRNRRYFSFEITLFDLQQESWSKIRWNNCLRSHASTLYGNMLMVYGGINEKDQYLNQIFFISLNANNIQLSTIMQYTTPIKAKAGIAFHKIVNTYQLQPSLKDRIDLDGIISYGGKFFDGSVCNDASIFRLNFKGREGFNYNKTEPEDCNGWEILSLKGRKPEGRYDHTMNILNKKGICLIVGGISESEQALKDIWIMDLCSFSWMKAEFDSSYEVLTRGIAGHSSTCDQNTLYIFGGIRRNHPEGSTKFFSLSFAATRTNNERLKTNGEESFNRTGLSKKYSQAPEDSDHS